MHWRIQAGNYTGDPLPREPLPERGDTAGPDYKTITHRYNGKIWVPVPPKSTESEDT